MDKQAKFNEFKKEYFEDIELINVSVEDLKNKIQNQINVIKTQHGSKLEVNF